MQPLKCYSVTNMTRKVQRVFFEEVEAYCAIAMAIANTKFML